MDSIKLWLTVYRTRHARYGHLLELHQHTKIRVCSRTGSYGRVAWRNAVVTVRFQAIQFLYNI